MVAATMYAIVVKTTQDVPIAVTTTCTASRRRLVRAGHGHTMYRRSVAMFTTIVPHQTVVARVEGVMVVVGGGTWMLCPTIAVNIVISITIVLAAVHRQTDPVRTFCEKAFRAATIVRTTTTTATLSAFSRLVVLVRLLVRRRYNNATIVHVVVVDHLTVADCVWIGQLLLLLLLLGRVLLLVLLLLLLVVGHVEHVVLLYQHVV